MPLTHQLLGPFTASLLCLILGAALALAALPGNLRRRAVELLPIRVDSDRQRRRR
jgi:hypothetical protein